MPDPAPNSLVSSPLRLHGSFRSRDLDEIRDLTAAAQHPIRIDVMDRRTPAQFCVQHHPLSRIALTHAELEYEGRLHISAPPLDDHYFLQLPLQGTAEVRHGDRTVGTAPGRTGMLLSPGLETTMRSRHGFKEFTLEIDAGAVARAWALLVGELPQTPIRFEPALRLDSEPGASVVRLTRFLADEVSRPTSLLSAGPVLDRLEEALVLCLLQGQPHSHDGRLRHRPSAATAALVADAEAWMEARAGERIGMAAVAQACGVTLRTLQRAFERHRAYPPREFLRRVRLGRVRERFRRGDASTVTQVALELGFRHLGRFSQDYRAQYGESPTRTLRRARHRGEGTGCRAEDPVAAPPRSGRDRCGLCVGEIPSV